MNKEQARFIKANIKEIKQYERGKRNLARQKKIETKAQSRAKKELKAIDHEFKRREQRQKQGKKSIPNE